MMQSKKRARVASAKAKALLVGSANVTSSVVVSAHKELNAEGKKLEEANEEIMAELLQVNRSKLNTQPLIVINHINNSQKEKKKTSTSSNGSSKSPEKVGFQCKVHQCPYKDLHLETLDDLLQHHNDKHPANRWSSSKCKQFNVYNCGRCNKVYSLDKKCAHNRSDAGSTSDKWWPTISWSITVAAVKTDVPLIILSLFDDFMNRMNCHLGIACLERGDKDNHLHLQAAAEVAWDPDDQKGICNLLRETLRLADYNELSFRVQCKPFEKGQNWMGMIGYCRKWRDHQEYRCIHRGMSEKDIAKGEVFLQVYRADYTKDKYVLDPNNIIKAAYAHWTATRKPAFVTFTDMMTEMLRSGDFVLSGKLLSCNPMDKTRTEQSWCTLLMPYETNAVQVNHIVFGYGTPKLNVATSPRYTLEDFTPSVEDKELINQLQHHTIRRRENTVLVGPPGCGKSCLIQTLTLQHGVRFFGTADELKEVNETDQFIVFDDFDFRDFSVDDVKRMLDREFPTQRVKVRYHDAKLTNKMTRIILCNELPEQFSDLAVTDR